MMVFMRSDQTQSLFR